MIKLSDLIALEYKLNQIKLEMNSMLATSGSDDHSAIIKDRIAFLESQVKHLSNQLELMKAQYTGEVPTTIIPESSTETLTSVAEHVDKVEATVTQESIPPVVEKTVTQAVPPTVTVAPQPPKYTAGPVPVAPVKYAAPKPARDLEHTVGKNVMGIVASCLIFIGLILFGFIIYPYLTDNIRLIAMYAISLAFIVFGYIKSEKQPDNKFYISLLACGTGAIYITLLMTSIYFKKIDEIVLYILLFIWSLIACFLSRKRGTLFQIIGELGLLISLIFGASYCYSEESQLYSFILLGYFVLTSTVYLLMHFRKTLEGNLIHFIMHVIAAYTFVIACLTFSSFFSEPAITIFGWILAAYIYSHIMISNILIEKKSGVTLTCLNLFYAFAIILLILEVPLGGTMGCGIITLAFSLIMLALQSHSLKEFKTCKIVSDCGIITLGMIGLLTLDKDIMTCLVVFVAAVTGIIFGAAYSYIPYQVGGYVALALLLTDLYTVPALLRIALTVVLLLVLFFTTKKWYTTNTKICNYLFFMWALCNLGDSIINELKFVLENSSEWYYTLKDFVPVLLVSIVQMVAIKCNLYKHWITKEEEKHSTIAFGLIHIVIMFAALFFISDNKLLREVMILVALALFLINNNAILNRTKDNWPGIYVLGKLTLLLIVSVNAYDSPEYLVSVACFILSVISIVLGFKFKRKSFRTYGLVLSLLSVVKLVVVDIHYENTIGRATSFLVCGVLCFIINIIYNRIDKMNAIEEAGK